MADTPRNYVAFRGAGCARDRVPGHDGQTDLRLIGAVQIIEPISRAPYRGAHKWSRAPERCIFNGPPGLAREAPTTRQQSAKQTHLWSTRVYVSRAGPASVSRTTCPLNIHESPARMRGGSERDIGRGELARGLIAIALICPLHIRVINRGNTATWYAQIALLSRLILSSPLTIRHFLLFILNDVCC